AYCILEFHTTKSVTVVERHFRTQYQKDPPNKKTIRTWYARFSTIASPIKPTELSSVSNENVERIREAFVRSPRKSTVQLSRELVAL
ncbi:hypothetical protein C0J52_08907, partial [Blattella germanica]